VIALVSVLAIRVGLRPLSDLSRQVHELDIHHDPVLQAPPHEEFKAVARSIDDLIKRHNAALTRERQLASEVAHELRSPLASLALNAAALRGALSPAECDETSRRIVEDSARAGSIVSWMQLRPRQPRQRRPAPKRRHDGHPADRPTTSTTPPRRRREGLPPPRRWADERRDRRD